MDIRTIYTTKKYGRVHKVFAGYVAVPTIGDPSFHFSLIGSLAAIGAPHEPDRCSECGERSLESVHDELRKNA